MPKKSKTVGWSICRVAGVKAANLGLVWAKSADDAIKKAIEEYDLDPREAKRLMSAPEQNAA